MNPSQANKEDGPIDAMDWSPDELHLLRAGRDEPTESTRAGIFAALGLDGAGPGGGGPGDGGASVQLPRAEAPPASLPSSPLPVFGAPPAVATAGFGVGSWIVVGALVAAVPVGFWLTTRSSSPEAPRADQSQPAGVDAEPARDARPPTPGPEPVDEQRDVRELGDLPVADGADAASSKSTARSQPGSPAETGSAAGPSTLAEELSWIRRARAELTRGAPAAALAALDDYVARYPRPQLSTEALVVRVEALVKLGRKDEARRVAAPLLAEGSVYAERVRSILGERSP